ncbi:cholesterol transporter ABCA5-like [Diabrotica undecimpunctata]|uniref:cholesterol transporter ABCA5-like n=1 Tax=Diabrotica undecimpunctata TaxID=50387 RepID=UPI003B639C6F
MADQAKSLFCSQLKAMLKRNFLIKKRQKLKTIGEILFPLYFLGLLVVIELVLPDPNLPEINTPRGEEYLFTSFNKAESHKIAYAPNTTDNREFVNEVTETWKSVRNSKSSIEWVAYSSEEEVLNAYDQDHKFAPIAVIFNNDSSRYSLSYQIRTNPYYISTPNSNDIGWDKQTCRGGSNPNSNMEDGSTCPTNTYYFSGFLALQTLLDYTQIRRDNPTQNIPYISLEICPKPAVTVGDWANTIRIIVPVYMVIALSQFITYLIILIVGEKEKKIKEGMKLMGLMDKVFWLSWLIIYTFFVLFLATVSVLLLYFFKIFDHVNLLLIFILMVLYGISLIMFAFMLTPFFDKARTAGVLSSFILVLIVVLYYVEQLVSGKNPQLVWALSLLSPAGFAAALDKVAMSDIEGIGLNFDNLWDNHGSGVPFGGTLVMLMVDIVLYATIAYYLDNVIPSAYGVKRSPFFFLMPSFWVSKHNQMPPNQLNPESSADVEPVPRQMQDQEAIRIMNLNKSFRNCRKPTVTALDGINLSIYKGQITAILGHNGAGKTTLFNILTGLSSPTSGSAFVFGYDVRNTNDMDKIRRMTGVCPQHDILFDDLTPREHLEFFAAIKGISNRKYAIDKIIREIDLVDKIDTASKSLSGGQKRKLSIGIALIGDPKIIILDEPTAGVDPYSRRHLWNVLQNVRHDKVILLTTHFMDEADILADRKAVVSKGKVRCCGSSLFLKNKFGIGYHLTFVLEDKSNENAINRLILQYVKMARKDRRHGKELSFILPHNAVENFASLFAAIEHEISVKSDLGISSYGVSMTTLEEVFLGLQKEEEYGETREYQELQHSSENLSHGNTALSEGIRSLEAVRCNPSASQNLRTLIGLRFLRLRREKRKLWMVIILPIIFTALGLYLNKSIDTGKKYVPPKTYPQPLNLNYYRGYNTSIYNDSRTDLTPFTKELKNNGADLDTYDGNFTSLLKFTTPHYGAFNVHDFSSSQNISVLYNDTYQHLLPMYINLISNTFYSMGPKTGKISAAAYPFELPPTNVSPTPVSPGNFILGMVFLFAPIVLAVDMVYEREIKARNQLRVNGLPFTVYFTSFFLVQVLLMAIITVLLIGLIIAMKPPTFSNSSITVLALWVVLYCPASVLFCSCISYMFDKSESAQSVMPNVSTLLGLIPYIPVMYAKESVGTILHYVFTFTDMMYVPYGILYYIQKVSLECKSDAHCTDTTLSSFMIPEIIVLFVTLIIQIPVLFLLMVILDVKKNGGQILDIFRSKKTFENIVEDTRDVGVHEDQDVKNEKRRVNNLIRDSQNNRSVITVENLHKVYQKGVKSGICSRSAESLKVAIKSISLAVDSAEVFGLLGHNGAGKTTAMKIITAEEAPTRGRVQIVGRNITSSANAAFQYLGYCPQHDAQWKNITVKEHLELYSRIRGIPKNEIKRTVDLYLTGLQINEHKDKQAEKCSGGTRRKLSYAMAMIGNPKIVLLDEPSTGMDPQSKRFLWDTVLASFRGSRGAILTTHSMEEADALCSRIGIMVNGELRCLGSSQHLKNLYGAGYNLEVKLATQQGTDLNQKLKELENYVFSLFPNAVLQETFGDRLIFSVPQQSVPSLANCFRSLEDAKCRLNIEEYSFSQTTLEQVFLKFAQEGEHED